MMMNRKLKTSYTKESEVKVKKLPLVKEDLPSNLPVLPPEY